jgi:SAM-dependent methyltransferase
MDSIVHRLRRSLVQRGAIGTARMCLEAVRWQFAPAFRREERERQRQDEDFDRSYGVDTGGVFRPDPTSVVGQNWAWGVNYQAADPVTVRQLIRDLSIPYPEFTFIDLGCGKGRVVLIAAGFPFERVVGVEYCRRLTEVARLNATRIPPALSQCGGIDILNLDAAEYSFPDGPLVLFLFNPFAEPVMRGVVRNAVEAFNRSPRRILVLYLFPFYGALWESAGIFKRLPSPHGIFDTGPVSAGAGTLADAGACA